MTQEEKKKDHDAGWGGRRKGSGRKKTCARRVFFSASTETAGILDEVEGSLSDYINKAILAYDKKKRKKTIIGFEISVTKEHEKKK